MKKSIEKKYPHFWKDENFIKSNLVGKKYVKYNLSDIQKLIEDWKLRFPKGTYWHTTSDPLGSPEREAFDCKKYVFYSETCGSEGEAFETCGSEGEALSAPLGAPEREAFEKPVSLYSCQEKLYYRPAFIYIHTITEYKDIKIEDLNCCLYWARSA